MWLNKIIVPILKSPLHGLLSRGTMLLTFSGRKSGKVYTIPINYVCSGEHFLSTSQRDRTWWRNVGMGEVVSLVVKGKNVSAASYLVQTQAEVKAGLEEVLAKNPRYARYFKIRQFSDGAYDQDDLQRVSAEIILVRFEPVN